MTTIFGALSLSLSLSLSLIEINCELYQSRDFGIFFSFFGNGKTDGNLNTLSHSIQWINTNKRKRKSVCVCERERKSERERTKLNFVQDDFAYFEDVMCATP